MPNLSKRYLRGKPMLVTTTASLAQIQAALIGERPSLAAIRGGWGNIAEDPELLNTIGAQPPITDPEILPAIPGLRPDVLAARRYWYNPLRSRVPGAVPQQVLDGADILLSAEGNNEYLLFVSTLTDRHLNTEIVPALQRAISGIDSSVTVSMTTSSVDFEDPDFFLWLVRQSFGPTTLVAPQVSIDDMDKVACYDPLHYETKIGRGASKDRLELLTMLANRIKVFGPATFSLTDTALDAALELVLSLDGSIDITVPSITYRGAGFTTTEEMRLRAVTDLLYVILPAMKTHYLADTGWRSGVDRDAFRAAMKREALAGIAAL